MLVPVTGTPLFSFGGSKPSKVYASFCMNCCPTLGAKSGRGFRSCRLSFSSLLASLASSHSHDLSPVCRSRGWSGGRSSSSLPDTSPSLSLSDLSCRQNNDGGRSSFLFPGVEFRDWFIVIILAIKLHRMWPTGTYVVQKMWPSGAYLTSCSTLALLQQMRPSGAYVTSQFCIIILRRMWLTSAYVTFWPPGHYCCSFLLCFVLIPIWMWPNCAYVTSRWIYCFVGMLLSSGTPTPNLLSPIPSPSPSRPETVRLTISTI